MTVDLCNKANFLFWADKHVLYCLYKIAQFALLLQNYIGLEVIALDINAPNDF